MNFKDLEEKDYERIKEEFIKINCNNCDFTLGALYMWRDYFNYQIAYYDDLIFIKGKDVDNHQEEAYAIPLGGDMVKGIEYLLEQNNNLILNVVPQEFISLIKENFTCECMEMPDWFDYIYGVEDLKELKGKKYNKKRNHLHQFTKQYLYDFQKIDQSNIEKIKNEFKHWMSYDNENILKNYDNHETIKLLDYFFDFNLLGGALYVNDALVAFTIGEIINDTLFVHVEKGLVSYEGVYQAINYLFVNYVTSFNDLKFINREEDVGDEGLRKAKLSYHPLTLKKKYRIIVSKNNRI